MAVLLLALAVPRTIAAWQGHLAEPVLQWLAEGKPVTDDELARAVARLSGAAVWVPSAPRLRDLALLEFNQAARLHAADTARAGLLQSAEAHLRAALREDPVDPVAWLRLVHVLELRGAPRREIAAALMKLFDAAPFDRGLWLWRSMQLVNHLAELTPDERDAFEANFRTMWAADPPRALQLAGFAFAVGQGGLAERSVGRDPEGRAALDRLRLSRPAAPPSSR